MQSSKVLINSLPILKIAYHSLNLLLSKILPDQPNDVRGDPLLAFLQSSNNLALSYKEKCFFVIIGCQVGDYKGQTILLRIHHNSNQGS